MMMNKTEKNLLLSLKLLGIDLHETAIKTKNIHDKRLQEMIGEIESFTIKLKIATGYEEKMRAQWKKVIDSPYFKVDSHLRGIIEDFVTGKTDEGEMKTAWKKYWDKRDTGKGTVISWWTPEAEDETQNS